MKQVGMIIISCLSLEIDTNFEKLQINSWEPLSLNMQKEFI